MKILRTLAAAALLFVGVVSMASAQVKPEDTMTITLKDGDVVVELYPEIAPGHVARIKELAKSGAYDNVAFHRVIDSFMAQTGDVQFGDMEDGFNLARAGTGSSNLPDLKQEFSEIPFEEGILGMARSQNPDSANSQFFIMFEEYPSLNNKYTVVGKVIKGMEHVNKIKRGSQSANGAVKSPDRMIKVRIGK